MTSWIIKLRRGEGFVWGTLKRCALGVLRMHIPVTRYTRPIFLLLYLLHVVIRDAFGQCMRFWWYEPLFRSRCVSIGRGFRMEQLPYIEGRGRIVIGDHVTFSGKPAFVFGNRAHDQPELMIGDHTFIGHTTSIAVSSSVRIGNHCLIAGGVLISDYDGHPTDAVLRRAGDPTPLESIRPVRLGDDVWIGANAILLKGSQIGDRSIVGAGAVVTGPVPDDCVCAGNPARLVKRLPRDNRIVSH